VDPQNIPRASRTWLIDVLPSKGKITYSTLGISLVDLLTVNHIPHILKKTIDDLEGLRRSYPSLIVSEPVQPPKYRLDVLPTEELLLDMRYCVT
jgi:hypothetical protein